MIVKVLQSLNSLKGGNEVLSEPAQSEKKRKNGDGAGNTALFWRGKTSGKVTPSDDEYLERASNIIGLGVDRSVENEQSPRRSPSNLTTELTHMEENEMNPRKDENLLLEEPPSYQVSETSNQWAESKQFGNTLNNNRQNVTALSDETRTTKAVDKEDCESTEKKSNQNGMYWNGKKLASAVNNGSNVSKSSAPQNGTNFMARNKGLRLVFSKHLDTVLFLVFSTAWTLANLTYLFLLFV